jgi:hypothetical protein
MWVCKVVLRYHVDNSRIVISIIFCRQRFNILKAKWNFIFACCGSLSLPSAMNARTVVAYFFHHWAGISMKSKTPNRFYGKIDFSHEFFRVSRMLYFLIILQHTTIFPVIHCF